MTVKKLKGKLRHAKSHVNNPSVIVSIPPIKKFVGRKLKLNTNYGTELRLTAFHTLSCKRNVNQINCSSFGSNQSPGLVLSSSKELTDLSPINISESLKKSSQQSDDALLNGSDDTKVDEVVKPIPTEETSKPLNWKLQKLEKKFLLKYLETTLQKYNKHICMQTWIPQRNKSYFVNQMFNFPNKRTFVGQTAKECLKSWLKRRVTSSVQMCTSKHKFTQTSLEDSNSKSLRNFHRWVRKSYGVVEAMDIAIREQDLTSLLQLDPHAMQIFHDVIKNLHAGATFSGIFEDDSWTNSVDYDDNVTGNDIFDEKPKVSIEDELQSMDSKKQQSQKKKASGKLPIKTTLKQNQKTTKLSPNLMLPGLSQKNTVKSTLQSQPVPSVGIKDSGSQSGKNAVVEREKTVTIRENDTIEFDESAFEATCKKISNYLLKSNACIQQAFLSKVTLHSLIILINESSQRLLYTMPFMDDVGMSFSYQLSSLQMDAKLAKRSFLDSISEEIMDECRNLVEYLNNVPVRDDPIYPLMHSIEQMVEETSAVFSPLIINIVEDITLLRDFVTLIKVLVDEIDHTSLSRYFNTLLETESVIKDTKTDDSEEACVSEVLDDFELLANALAVIHIWNDRKRDVLSTRSNILPDSFSMAVTYNSSDTKSNIENVNLWINQLSNMPPEDRNIEEIYEDFQRIINVQSVNKLRAFFVKPELLDRLVTNIAVTPEMCFKENELYNIYKSAIAENGIKTSKENDQFMIDQLLQSPLLIAQFLSIVHYLADGEDMPNVKNLFIQSDQNMLKHYLENGKDVIIVKLLQLGCWMSQLDKHWIFSDVQQYIGVNSKVVGHICNIIENSNLENVIKNIFNDSELLVRAIGAVKGYISNQPSKEEIVELEVVTDDQFLDEENEKLSKTEPVDDEFDLSEAKGKNHRYSHSIAENNELFTERDPESTSLNVVSLNNGKSTTDQVDQQITEPVSATELTVDAVREEDRESMNDPGATLNVQPNIDDMEIQNLTNIDEEPRKSFNIEDNIKIVVHGSQQSFNEKIPSDLDTLNVQDRPQSIDETDTNLGRTENADEHIFIESKTFVIEGYEVDGNQQMMVNVSIEFEGETKNFGKESGLTDSLDAERLSINSQINALVIKLDDTLASIEIQCQTMNDMDLDFPKFTHNQFCETNILLSDTKLANTSEFDIKSKLSSDGKLKAVKLDDHIISIDKPQELLIEAEVDVSPPLSLSKEEDLILDEDLKGQETLPIDYELNVNVPAEVIKTDDNAVPCDDLQIPVQTIGDGYKLKFSNQLVDCAYNFAGATTSKVDPNSVACGTNYQNEPRFNQVEVMETKFRDFAESIEEESSNDEELHQEDDQNVTEKDAPIYIETEIKRLYSPRQESNEIILYDKEGGSNTIPKIEIELAADEDQYQDDNQVEKDVVHVRNLSFNTQLDMLADKLDESLQSIDLQYKEMTEMEIYIPIATRPPVTVTEVIPCRDLEDGPNVSFHSQINNLEMRLDETLSLVDVMCNEMKDIQQKEEEINVRRNSDRSHENSDNIDRERSQKIDDGIDLEPTEMVSDCKEFSIDSKIDGGIDIEQKEMVSDCKEFSIGSKIDGGIDIERKEMISGCKEFSIGSISQESIKINVLIDKDDVIIAKAPLTDQQRDNIISVQTSSRDEILQSEKKAVKSLASKANPEVLRKNQSSQSEILDGDDLVIDGNETINPDTSSYQTITSLGFMVYYLLIVLAGRQSHV